MMDKNFIKDLLKALKTEFIRFRLVVTVVFLFVSFAVLFLGVLMPKSYTTNVLLSAEITKIIDTSVKKESSNVKIDRAEQAKEIIYTRGIIEAAAKARGQLKNDMTPEQSNKIVNKIRSRLTVKADKNSFFRLEYTSSDPDDAFETLNAIVNVFIADTERRKRDESANTYNFIDTQVQSYKKQLELAEERLKEFNARNVDGTEESVANRLAQLRTDIETIKISIEESQARVNALQQQLGSESQYQHAKGQADELRQRRQVLTSQLDHLLLTYQEEYPDIVSIKAQIAEVDASINKLKASGEVYTASEKVENPLFEEIRKQLSVADLELKAQKRRMESLVKLQEQEHERASRVASNQAEFSDLTRDYDVIRKTYEDLLSKKEGARLAMTADVEGQGVSYQIIEPASFPIHPTGIAFLTIAILGPISGLFLPILFLLAYVVLDPHIRSVKILQQQLPADVEILGAIPHYNTPLMDRLLRKDMLGLLAVATVSMVVYLSFVVYWEYLKG